MMKFQLLLSLFICLLTLLSCGTGVPKSDNCDCPLILLFHEEKGQQKDVETYQYTLPDVHAQLDPTSRKSLSGGVSLGKYEGKSNHSNSMDRSVHENSIYEISNANYRELCLYYKAMCIRGFQDEDWKKFQKMLNVYKKSAKFSGQSGKISPSNIQSGFRIINKDQQKVVFTYGYSGYSSAWLQLRINFEKDGQQHHWHRDDLLYALPNTGEMTLDLQQVGFSALPDAWDIVVYLLEPGCAPRQEYPLKDNLY